MENRKKSIEINFDGITYNDVPFKNWSREMQEEFIEGFVTNTLGNPDKYPYPSSSHIEHKTNNNTGHWTDKLRTAAEGWRAKA